jgi:hypothetical protein
MTETVFGPGGYGYAPPEVPSAPVLTGATANTVDITIGADNNHASTLYALYNDTDALYIDEVGNPLLLPVWRIRGEWGVRTVLGLAPATPYSFTIKAKNQAGSESEFGPSSEITTYSYSSTDLLTVLDVTKASSIITAPSFMSGLETSIKLAGKSLNDLGFFVGHIGGLDVPKIVPDEELVPGAHTWRIWDEYFEPKRIVLEGHVYGSSPEDFRLRFAYLKSFLTTFEGSPWRSSAPVKLERSDLPDRHWLVYYDAINYVELIGKRHLSSSARLRVTMKCPSPYAIANDMSRVIFTPNAGTFKVIDLGNAPSDAVYVIKGPAVNPSFTAGDIVFLCAFSDGLTFTNVENTEDTGMYYPSENEFQAYRTTETGTGILVTGTDTVSFSVTGNREDGAWVAVIIPQWNSTEQVNDVVILEHKSNDSNYLRLYWDASEDTWILRMKTEGTSHEVSSSMQTFTSETRIILGITYDSTNAGGMKLFIDGIQSGVGGNTTALASSPTTLSLHEGSGTMQAYVIFDHVFGWSRMLSSDEMMKIATDPTAVTNLNSSVSYSGSLDDSDILTFDSHSKTAVLFDVSEGTWLNVLGNVTGTIPILTPGRRRRASDRTQTVIYSKTAAGELEIRYRKQYL